MSNKKNTHILTRLRTEKGLTKTELANLAQVSVRTISDIENKHDGMEHVSGLVIVKLAKALGCTVADLVPEDAPPQKEINR